MIAETEKLHTLLLFSAHQGGKKTHSSAIYLQHKENVPHQEMATGILRELLNRCHTNAMITQREIEFILAL